MYLLMVLLKEVGNLVFDWSKEMFYFFLNYYGFC